MILDLVLAVFIIAGLEFAYSRGRRRERRDLEPTILGWREALMRAGINPDDPDRRDDPTGEPAVPSRSWTGVPIVSGRPVGAVRTWSDPVDPENHP